MKPFRNSVSTKNTLDYTTTLFAQHIFCTTYVYKACVYAQSYFRTGELLLPCRHHVFMQHNSYPTKPLHSNPRTQNIFPATCVRTIAHGLYMSKLLHIKVSAQVFSLQSFPTTRDMCFQHVLVFPLAFTQQCRILVGGLDSLQVFALAPKEICWCEI